MQVGKGGLGIECFVIDINSKGARLRFNSPVRAGTEIQLLFIPEHVSASGWVVWQEGREIGVEFVRPLSWLRSLDVSDPEKRPSAKPANG